MISTEPKTYPVTLVIPAVAFEEPEITSTMEEPAQQVENPMPESASEPVLDKAEIEPEPLLQELPDSPPTIASELANPVGEALSNYWSRVRAQIARNATYPYSALRQQLEGTVVVQLRVSENGELMECLPLDTSHPVLLEAALKAVHRSFPFPGPTGSAESDLSAVLPVHFQLNNKKESNE